MQKKRLDYGAQDPQHLLRSKPPTRSHRSPAHPLVDFSIFLEMCVDQLSRCSIRRPKYLTLFLNWIFCLKIQSFGEANLRFFVTSNASVFGKLTARELARHHSLISSERAYCESSTQVLMHVPSTAITKSSA